MPVAAAVAKKDAFSMEFGNAGLRSFTNSSNKANLKPEEFPDLDNVGKIKAQPVKRAMPKEEKSFTTAKDAPSMF